MIAYDNGPIITKDKLQGAPQGSMNKKQPIAMGQPPHAKDGGMPTAMSTMADFSKGVDELCYMHQGRYTNDQLCPDKGCKVADYVCRYLDDLLTGARQAHEKETLKALIAAEE